MTQPSETARTAFPEGLRVNAGPNLQSTRAFSSPLENLERFVATCAASATAPDAFAPALDTVCAGAGGADRASILLFDPDGVLRFKAWRGLSSEYRAAVEGHTPWTRDTVDAAPIIVGDVSREPSLAAFRATIVGEGIHGLSFVPIAASGRLLGKMMLYYDRPARPDVEALRIAQAVASSLGVLVARTRTEESLRLLVEAGDRLNRSLDHEQTLRVLGELCVPALADWALIFGAGQDGAIRRLHQVAADSMKAELLERLDQSSVAGSGLGEEVFRTVLRTGEAVCLSTVEDNPRLAATNRTANLERQLDARSVIVAPMRLHDATVGVLAIVASESGRRYTASDCDMATELARRAGVAVENGRLFHAERAARDAAEAANRAKSQFLAVMSHELRTPLTAITGYASLLTHGITGDVTDPQRKQLDRIDASARHLLSVIDEILTFSRLDAGYEEPYFETVDAGTLTREAAAMVEPMIQVQGLAFTVAAPDDHRCVVYTDPRMVRQILLNLLSNATRYTRHGKVGLTLTHSVDAICWEVRDTGVGIAQADLERIFRPFEQVDGKLTRRYGGVGLGLAVSRQLTERVGGELDVQSTPGRGSTFTLRLPRRAASASN